MEELTNESNGQTVVRHLSCEQISYGGDKVKIERFVHEFSISHDNTQQWKSWTMKFEGPSNAKNEIVDLSEKTKPKINDFSIPKNDIKPSILNNNENKSIRKRFRPLQKQSLNAKETSSEGKEMSYSENKSRGVSVLLTIIVLLTALIASISIFLALHQRVCEMILNVQELKFRLELYVYGQEDAISKIVSQLNEFSYSKKSGITILALLGGVGVGKSYTASIISKHFLWQNNVQEFVMPVHKISHLAEEVIAGYQSCGDNLVVIDGLKPGNVTDCVVFLQQLMELNNLQDTRAVVLLVFSVQNNLHEDVIHKTFQAAGLQVTLVPFQELKQEHIEACIEESLLKKGISYSVDAVQQVMSLLPSHTGCKGVASKVQLVTTPETELQQSEDMQSPDL
ncbi:hypothetical protein C0J52_25154 [Blattella germanica]|nr:hypothetical protein C0J52_25154 [Blattella germanica]